MLLVFCSSHLLLSQIIIDHTCTDIRQIPQTAIENAKNTLHIGYGHTSHGSQITDGMSGLIQFANNSGKGLNLPDDIFAFNNGGTNGALDLEEGDGYGNGWLDHDCGYYPDWVNETREYLDAPSHSDVNVIMWSWCGQASHRSEQEMIDTYLAPMTQLEAEYPEVTFVYMTGHADGSGLQGNLHQRNQQIRTYCRQNGKVLYDFYNIECYDPDGTYYGDQNVNDQCNYNGGNWAIEWQNSHTQGVDWYQCGSAHSQPLNANQKAYAAWWLWARLAGWNGPVEDDTAPSVPQNPVATAISQTRIDLSWDASQDVESGVTGYRVYRQGSLLTTVSQTLYSDFGCAPGQTYAYRISAVNGAGLESEQSAIVQATTPADSEPPSVPTGLTAVPVSSSQIDLSWSASVDNSAVAGYSVYRNGEEFTQVAQPFFSDSALDPNTTYTYRVLAFDAAGNRSGPSSSATATTLAASQEQQTIKLQSQEYVDDSFIFAHQPNSNYGNESYRSAIDHFVIKFNLPAILSGKQILSAKIAFYVWNQQNYAENEYLNLYCIERQWEENQVTWTHATTNQAWTLPGGDHDSTPCAQIPHQSGQQNWDHTFYPPANITALVQQWVDGSRENNGLLVMNSGQTQIGFKASEYSADRRPYLEITYTDAAITLSYDLLAGWNFLSVPLNRQDMSISTLFPGHSSSDAYRYNGDGYDQISTVEPHQGFWLKSTQNQTIEISGQRSTQISCNLQSGWNQIGSLSVAADFSDPLDDPDQSVPACAYTYDPLLQSYYDVTILEPAKGYWVYSYNDALLIIALGSPGPPATGSTLSKTPPPPPQLTAIPQQPQKKPDSFRLYPNYPNPFNPVTTIQYDLPVSETIDLRIFNHLGEEIDILVQGYQKAGRHQITWHANRHPSGLYFYKLKYKDRIQFGKMLLIK
jgi:hypothetical protein